MSEPRRSVVFTDIPPPPMLRDATKPVDVFDLDSDNDEGENGGGVVPAAAAGEEGGAKIEMKVDSSDESAESETSSEEQSSKDGSDDDEDALCRSVDKTKDIPRDVCGKAMDLFFRKAEEQNSKICCDFLAENDGLESDLCEPEAKKPRIPPSPFALEIGPVIIAEGAEPLDKNYDKSLKMLVGNNKMNADD